jgi:CBS domain containing-hemolysin-like protein
LRFILQGFAERCCALLGASTKRSVRDMSQAEFRNLVDAGSAQGQVNARERRMIHRVFEFADKNVGQIMTPRDRMFSLSFELPMARLSKEIAARGFSRVPIYQKSVDNIRGIVNAKDVVRILRQPAASRGLAEILHEPLFVPRATPVKRLFVTFQQKKVHMALVVNEYGKVLGLVTMDDVLSQLFGVLRDEREGKQRQGRPARRIARTPPSGIAQSDISDVVDKIDPSDISDVRDETGASQIQSMALAQSARPLSNTGTSDVREGGSAAIPIVIETDGEDGGQ